MIISMKNKKSRIIKGVTLLIAFVMLFTIVLTSCVGNDALEAAKKAQVAADEAKIAATAAQAAADAARAEADAAKDNAQTAQDTADAAMTSENVADAIRVHIEKIAQIEAQLGSFMTTTDVATAIQAQLTTQLENYMTTAQVNAAVATQLASYMTSAEVTTMIATQLSSYMTSAEVATAIQAQLTLKLADYMTAAQVDAALQAEVAQQLAIYMTDTDVANAFTAFADEYDAATVVAIVAYAEIEEALNDMLTNSDLYPSTNLLNSIKELSACKLEVMRALNVLKVQEVLDRAEAIIESTKSYPLLAYEAYLAVDEFIYPIANGTIEQNPYSSQEQINTFLAAVTINTGDPARDAVIMAAINNYVVDATTTLDLEAEYNDMAAAWAIIKNFGDITAPQLVDAINDIDSEFETITLDQTVRYNTFKDDVDAADAIYTGVKTAIGADNVNIERLITNLQKLTDAKAYKATLAQLATVPSDYVTAIDALLNSTGWTANGKVLYSTYKTISGDDASISLLKAEVESWATTNGIVSIATLIPNYVDLVNAYDYAETQYDAYTAFETEVKPAIEGANAAVLALSNEALFTDAKTKLDLWEAAGVDDINLLAIYKSSLKATFEAGLARIAQLNDAKTAAVAINTYIATFAPPTDITINTAKTLMTYWENTIRDAWCVTYEIPYDDADALYIDENYALVNIDQLDSYIAESKALVAIIIAKGEEFVNAVKAIPGYTAVVADNNATLYSYSKIEAARVLYNTWSDENLIVDPMFSGLSTEVSKHYAIWSKLSSSYATLEAQAIADFAAPSSAISAIGSVGIYSELDIIAAESAYGTWQSTYLALGTTGEGLKASIKTMINTKLTTLTTSRETFDALKATKVAETQRVIDLIAAIPTPVTTSSFGAIIEARAAYDVWHLNIDDIRPEYVVTNYTDLQNAEITKNDITVLIDAANTSLDTLEALILDPATEAITDEYLDAINLAKADLAAFIAANGDNDYAYVSEAQINVIAIAEEKYDLYNFNNIRGPKLADLADTYNALCADPANAAYVPQFTAAYNQQVNRINLVERTKTYIGLTAEQEMDRLVDEFDFLIQSILDN